MKIQHFALALIAAGVANMAMAANTITFTGTVEANTCTVNIDGNTNPTVTLPTVGVGSLTATGNTAGATPFTISITGCEAGTTDNVAVRFAAHNPDGTNLGSTGSATNVAVQLLNGSAGSTPITFTTGIAQTAAKTINNGTASYDLTAQYYANAAATAGTVLAVTDYEVIYP